MATIRVKQLDSTNVSIGALPIRGSGGINWSDQVAEKALVSGLSFSDNGSASSPSLTFQNGASTGFYLLAPSKVGVATGGSLRLFVNTVSMTAYVPLRLQTSSSPVFTFDGDTDTGLGSSAANKLELYAGGVARLSIDGASLVISGSGSITLPRGSTSERGQDTTTAQMRFNSDTDAVEARCATGWASLVRFTRKAVTGSSYEVSPKDYLIGVQSGVPTSIILPPGEENMNFIIKDESGTSQTNAITIIGSNGQFIDGLDAVNIGTNFGAMTIYFSGSQWHRI